MRDYTVYFEIYGKKMKATVKAFNEAGAELIIRNELKVLKVEKKNPLADIVKNLIDTVNKMS